MNFKNKLIYRVNKAYFFTTRLPYYLKKIFAAVLPKTVKQNIKQGRLFRYVSFKFFKTNRTPRVYVKAGIGRMEFFEILHRRKIEYVLLRWWENLPDMPPDEDMDILIKDEHRDLIGDLITFYDNGSGMKADIYTISGVKYGSHRKLPYFQSGLAHILINSRVLFKGAYVPSSIPYFASLAYHAVFHKGRNSGIPGFDAKPSFVEHDYNTILNDLALKVGIEVDITIRGLYEWLKKENYAPANDTLTKLIEVLPELSVLEEPLTCDARGGELLTFVVRERLIKDGLLNNFTAFLEKKYQFDIIDVRLLKPEERTVCTYQIRGGKWDRGPYKYSGGPPAALVVAYDYHPKPLSTEELTKQSRMTNKNNLDAKYVFRESLTSLFLIKGDYNCVHSADNEPDAWSYISLVNDDYCREIFAAVESRRVRYAGKWGVKKLVSYRPESKTELIDYNCTEAVKKTFRVGKERFFKRELFALKELSKELDFIPGLLEEGDGYIVVPYLENVLDTLTYKEKKLLLASKKNEIIKVIQEMYARGLAYVNFTPENVIVTPQGGFYCTNFEFLYKYTIPPVKIEDAYEVAGLPGNFKGDYPDFYLKASSFNTVWRPYLGGWKKIINNTKLTSKQFSS